MYIIWCHKILGTPWELGPLVPMIMVNMGPLSCVWGPLTNPHIMHVCTCVRMCLHGCSRTCTLYSDLKLEVLWGWHYSNYCQRRSIKVGYSEAIEILQEWDWRWIRPRYSIASEKIIMICPQLARYYTVGLIRLNFSDCNLYPIGFTIYGNLVANEMQLLRNHVQGSI